MTDIENSSESGYAVGYGPMRLRQTSFLRPPDGIREGFERAVQLVLRKCLQLHKESRTLATLRDTLLPKLPSGVLSMAATDKKFLSVKSTSKVG